MSLYLLAIGLGSFWINRHQQKTGKSAGFDTYLWINAVIGVMAVAPILLLDGLGAADPLKFFVDRSNDFMILPFLGDLRASADRWRLVYTFGLTLLWPGLLLLVPAFFMGAAFPVGISLIPGRANRRDSGVSMGYAIVIAGNALGGLVTTFLLLPRFGTMRVLAGFAAIQVAFLLLLNAPSRLRPVRWAVLLAAALLVVFSPGSGKFYQMLEPKFPDFTSYFQEGVEGVVLTFDRNGVIRNFINGSAHGGRPGEPFIRETLVALSYAPSPRRALVIGFGTGSIVDTLQHDARVESITVVELNHTLIDNLSRIPSLRSAFDDPRVRFVFDDGRRFLQGTGEKFDIVTVDTLRTRSAFSNNIYSKQFFDLVRESLSDKGVFLVWTDDNTGTLAKTLSSSFSYVDMYRFLLIASQDRLTPVPQVYAGLFSQLPPEIAEGVANIPVRCFAPTTGFSGRPTPSGSIRTLSPIWNITLAPWPSRRRRWRIAPSDPQGRQRAHSMKMRPQ